MRGPLIPTITPASPSASASTAAVPSRLASILSDAVGIPPRWMWPTTVSLESEGTYDSRLTVVGHIQRGGIPTASDRILASWLGTAAVESLADGETGVMVGIRGQRIERVPLDEVVSKEQPLDPDLYRMAGVLAELPE